VWLDLYINLSFKLIINETPNKCRPVERKLCSDTDSCFWQDLYFFFYESRNEFWWITQAVQGNCILLSKRPYFREAWYLLLSLQQCFSAFVRPRPGKFFFIRRGPGPNKFTRKYLSIFLSSYIKRTEVLIINYGTIINSISTLMYTVWHVDKYKITFNLVINWTNEIL